jgi:hypothetical protein
MTSVTAIVWPQTDPAHPTAGSVPPEFDALLAELAAITGVTFKPATQDMTRNNTPVDQAPDHPCLIVHQAFLEGVILSFKASVTHGLDDTAASFSIFGSTAFDTFFPFRKNWIASNFASDIPRLNISRVRADPTAEISTVLRALAPKRYQKKEPSAADIKRIVDVCQPLLDMSAPAQFRHLDHKLIAQLRQIKLPRKAVIGTFQNLMQRAPKDEEILFFQSLPSIARLKDSLMTSQEYLTRFGLVEAEIQQSYLILLGREVTAAEVKQVQKTHPDLTSLRKMLLESVEFSRQFAKLAGPGKSIMTGMAGHNVTAGPVAFASPPNLQATDTDRVVFLHIPKCGGTTLHNMLRQWYQAENVHAERFNGLYGYTAASLASSVVFSGHYDYYSTTLIPGPKKMISFLRDPMDRLVSLYNFHRAHSPTIIERNNLQLPRWANEHNIDTYFAHPTIREHPAINNSIVRYFSNMPQVAHILKDGSMKSVTLDDMLDQALRNLETFAFVGFMDQYSADIDRLAATLNQDPPAEVRKHQVLDDLMDTNPDMRKIDKQKPNQASQETMEDLVAYDRVFYARARELFA